jgi:XTP/dITP diphosphohydrolase
VRVVLATGNRGKLAELARLLAPHAIELVAQRELGVADAEEIGLTFVENAILKARHAAAATGLPAIADDSGLVVDALGGAPGVRSARYAGEGAGDPANLAKLLAELRDVPESRRTARFVCAMVLLRAPDDPLPLIAQGEWRGEIAPAPRGANGFGYDPVFFVPTHGCTAAELAPDVKNAISHRGQALRALVAMLAAR